MGDTCRNCNGRGFTKQRIVATRSYGQDDRFEECKYDDEEGLEVLVACNECSVSDDWL